MRLRLVALLLQDPNLLVLDEPVNYLDLPTLLHLERFLKTFRGACILTSHDRGFLNAVADRTVEIERGRLTTYPGPVDAYLARKAGTREHTLKTNRKIQREREHVRAFVDRFRFKASKAKQVQSRIKRLSKLTSIDIESLLPTARIRIPSPTVTTGPALHAENLTVGYDGRALLSGINLDLARGDHLALLGANGAGKTTLLKTLSGALPAVGGKCKWWHKAKIGYYAQHVEASLRPEDTIIAHLRRSALPDARPEDLLKMAGDFLFKEDDLDKPTAVLSGGERARLCLAGLLLGEHNVLLLDEPTNHLDAETSEALAAALRDYRGTLVFVSHSQAFIAAVASRICEAREGRVREYPGRYEDYLADLSVFVAEEAREAGADAGPEDAQDAETRRYARQIEKEKRRRLQKLEERMNVLDREKSEILAWYFEHPTEYAPEKRTRLGELDEALSGLEKEWFRLQEETGT